ncbi:MAG: cytochrome c3 family protein [Vicinamibacterales bacterium]
MTFRWSALVIVAVLLAPLLLSAQATVTSPANKHNLSVSGPGPVKATTMTEICIFCHTPHNSNPATPLWNQTQSASTYTPYTSTTMAATAGVPLGSSKLCLSCHDGTIALGSTVTRGQIAMQGLTGGKLTGAFSLGTNLADDHPIAFAPITSSELVAPAANSGVKLDQNGQLQCRSCHDPHQMDKDPTTMKFLVTNNSSSSLCVVCHRKQYWTSNPSSHQASTKPYAAVNGAHTGYVTVATNGCESCHKPHGASTPQRSLKAVEEVTCAQCHGPTSIGRNIQAEFAKVYTHPTYSVTPSVHDASESPDTPSHPLPEPSAATPRHAECADCHNSHASYAMVAAAPKGSGKVAGVWGINATGSAVQPSGTPPSVNEYEICFKCHGDSANLPQPTDPLLPRRVTRQFNMRLMFATTNPSFHPVEGRLTGASGFSIKTGWTATSVIYCTDCHDNDTGPKAATPGTGPAGPHGSNIKHLLVNTYNSETDTRSAALCFKCHDSTRISQSGSWRNELHRDHHGEYSCSTCHDPHGTNNTNLINFDTRFVTPSSSGILRFDDLGTNRGTCYLTCHGRDHNPLSY